MSDHTPEQSTQEIPYGYCHCGCGNKAPLAPQTMRSRGWIRGQPVRFIHGHHARLQFVPSIEVRLWERVNKDDGSGCWLFTGSRNVDGYGSISFNQKTVGAHRVAYELTYGPIPEGAEVCHKCDNPICVNPAHLFLGTHQENIADCVAKGRQKSNLGQNNPNAKIAEPDVLEIRRLHKEGIPSSMIARRYNLSYVTVRAIVRHKLWKHVL